MTLFRVLGRRMDHFSCTVIQLLPIYLGSPSYIMIEKPERWSTQTRVAPAEVRQKVRSGGESNRKGFELEMERTNEEARNGVRGLSRGSDGRRGGFPATARSSK